jgi:hypothetical protein
VASNALGHGRQGTRRGHRVEIQAALLHRLPERGEHPVRLAIVLAQFPRLVQQGAVAGLDGGPFFPQNALDFGVAGDGGGFVEAVPIQAIRAGLAHQLRQGLQPAAAPDDEPRTQLAQRFIQRREAMMQPPSAGAAHGPIAAADRLVDVDGNDPLGGGQGGAQGGMVGQAQVAAEPEEGGFHGAFHLLGLVTDSTPLKGCYPSDRQRRREDV